MGELYYLQDKRSIVGNSMMWWAINGCGYTCDIRCAQTWTKEELVKLNYWENNELAQREWWKQAGLKYNLDFENYEYSYKPQTEEIVLVGSIQEKAIQDLVSNINARNFIRDEIKKAFKGKSPTPEGEKETR